ncbi:MAG TPA: hypothetical protein VF851_01625 [Steroidobacteraceae bacterium]
MAVPSHPFVLRAGPGAIRHVRERGLSRGDICCIPAAAGGPKGLALLPLDRLLLREWLDTAAPVELIGASVGAWRMAALARPDAAAALDRVQHAYVHEQCYTARPDAAEVTRACRRIAHAARGDGPLQWRDGVSLSVVTSRARGPLHGRESKLAFGRAVLSNALSRQRLARYLERVVFHGGTPTGLLAGAPFDEFGLVHVALDDRNAEDALLASGSIPLIATPVRDIAGAPPGNYWDGALVDYHLLLPYPRLSAPGGGRIVFYPHFNDYVTPGWLDKHLPWRRAPRAHPWLRDVLLVAPSPAFLATLPNGKLPDRQDFYRYGPDHAGRIRAWETAIAECGRFAEAVLEWMGRPDPSLIEPI